MLFPQYPSEALMIEYSSSLIDIKADLTSFLKYCLGRTIIRFFNLGNIDRICFFLKIKSGMIKA